MELNSLLNKFKGKSGKIITFVLIGILLLIIVMPVKNTENYKSGTGESSEAYGNDNSYGQGNDNIEAYTSCAAYYEEKLKNILEKSYGKGTMEVMVSLKGSGDTTNPYYSDSSDSDYLVDGVLIVADIKNNEEAANISFAVCALFNLPAHKVFVLIKK